MLWNLLGPLILIIGFYALLGGAVWLILKHPPRLPARPATRLDRLLVERLAVDPAVARQALWLAGIGLVGLLAPGPGWLDFLAAQVLAVAVLIILLDRNQRRREANQAHRQLLMGLGHPQATVAAAALRQAEAAGWLTNGALARQNLHRVEWAGAPLAGADLQHSNLAGANLQGADLRAANLTGCMLNGACLADADCSGATFDAASLVGVNAKGANFTHAELRGANLRQARLTNADFTAALLEDADLSGAGLKGARLDQARLTRTRYSQATRWPKRYDPLGAGALLSREPDTPTELPEHSREVLR